MPSLKASLKLPEAKKRFKAQLMSLSEIDWTEKPEQYCDYRLDGKSATGWLRVKQYANGTLWLETSTEPLLSLVTAFLDAGSVQTVASSQPSVKKGSSEKPSGLLNVRGMYIGTDESGKGDYFGPLVVAGVLVDDKTAAILAELGVCDSKKLNDKTIQEFQKQILEVVSAKAVCTVEMGPAKYNELYQRFKANGKNLNHLLAWGHATVMENLLVRYPECGQAIADQFGNEQYIRSQLKEKGKQITLFQTPRAEANIGVAAASVIARAHFVKKINQLSARFEVKLPMGAGANVKEQARLFIRRHGKEQLGEVAKLHFKTTQEL